MVHVTSKWDHVGTSIFSLMTQRAVKSGAVNLAQGFPDFDGPEVIKDAAIAAIRSAKNQYAPSPGIPELRKLLAARQSERTGLKLDWNTEVTVCSGATEALYCAMQAYLNPGDEVLAFEPGYDSYAPAAHAAGAKLVGVPLVPPSWRFDPAALRRAVTPRTKALILNTPNNPTGRVFTRDELEEVRQVALAHDLIVVTDEVYEELVYAPAKHLSFAALPGMAERTLTVSSTSKTFSFTGWKVGYAFGPPALTGPLRAVHQFSVFCSATPLQYGMVAALELGSGYYDDFRREYRERRDALVGILEGAGFGVAAPEGTYFVLADYSRFSEKRDVDFAIWLTETIKVAAIPITAFYTDPADAARCGRYVRFAFCKGMDTLRAARDRLKALKPGVS